MTLEKCADKENLMSIPEYFAGQTIFVTGGTGLMGKVLIEKILRSCPGVDKIYLLIRPKKGVAIQDRWNQLTQLPLFEKLRSERPEAFDKVVLIPGNINDEDINISAEHIKLIEENVTMIYHAAALIQFTDSVTDALIQNVRGTLGMLEISKNIKNLKVFVYVSTAYSNFNMPCEKVTEEVHPCSQDWKVLMKLLKTDPNALYSLREKLLCGHPNPYTWSKSIAEQIVNDYQQFFPVIIVRPGVVSATDDDPIPAWSDGTNAGFTICSLIYLGILRVAHGGTDVCPLDVISVDTAIKAFLIAPWKLHTTGPQKMTEVYTCTTASEGAINYEDILNVTPWFLEHFPSKEIIWPPNCQYIKNTFLYNIAFFILQVIPGSILDLTLKLRKKKPIFLKLSKHIVNGNRVCGGIQTTKVVFPNQRFKELTTHLKEEDMKDFGFTIKYTGEAKQEFMRRQVIACFKYYLKEDMCEENLKKNKKRYERIKKVHFIVTNVGKFFVTYYVLVGAYWVLQGISNALNIF